ncbi:MAG: hypothetical protein KME20_14025 [Kaiparowitsia implicata GSE-PSE-MK54-09C]|jgi:hypothetical protein|nr:hypothetical protein [Kaiparowitsia implicata GSE-PSE-MK54-09C]
MSEDHQLWIVADTEEVEEIVEIEGRRSSTDRGGGFGLPDTVETVRTVARRKRVSLDAQALKTQMESMLAIVNDLFGQADAAAAGLRLDEVELSVEINTEGHLSIVGNGGKLGNSGGIKLKFTRPH